MGKILVFGGAGFVGSHLVSKLVECVDDPYNNIIVIDNLSTGLELNVPSQIRKNGNLIRADVTDHVWLQWLTSYVLKYEIETVYYLIAKARVQPSIKFPIEYNDVNVSGLLNILNVFKDIDTRFVYSSSSSVYGSTSDEYDILDERMLCRPMSPYGLQKYIGEQYCKLFSSLYKIDTVCLRYFNVYGHNNVLYAGGSDISYMNVINSFYLNLLNNQPLIIYNDGNQTRDFTYVDDIVTANLLVASYTKPFDGDVFNVCASNPVSINDIAKYFSSDIEYIPGRFENKHNRGCNDKIKELGWDTTMIVTDWIQHKLLSNLNDSVYFKEI